MSIIIGTAGWSIPGKDAARFGPGGSALQRYATRFGGVEINSSFHRPHRHETWERWADSVAADFRFAVKVPRTISHERKLADCGNLLARFLDEVGGLDKLAILLLQPPPKLAFDPRVAEPFLAGLAGASPPIRRSSRPQRCRAAGGVSAIGGCTARRAHTAQAMTTGAWTNMRS